MNILYFSQFYMPESIAPAFRATDNSRLWKQAGHTVTVFTGYPNYPVGKIFDGYEPKLLTEECINGVRVLRSKLIAKPITSMAARLQNALGYFFFGWINTHFQIKKIGKDYDVVIGTSGIIFNALLAKLFASKIKKPYVFEMRDITYIQMQATGKSRNNLTVRGMKALELWLCRKAAKVVVVTNGFKNILASEGIPDEKIEVITNGVNAEISERAYDSKNKFVLSYFGTFGISQNIANTFQYAAVIAKIIPEFQYLIIGDGAQRKEIEDAAVNYEYIEVLPGMPSSQLEPYYNDTQLSVVTLQKSDNFKYTIPSKIFQVMGRGIAVLFIGPEGESADIIRKYKAGITLTGTLENDLMILQQFFSEPDWEQRLRDMGCNGRKAVEEHYLRSKLALDYIGILESARSKNCHK